MNMRTPIALAAAFTAACITAVIMLAVVDTANARPITLDEARAATIKQARKPSTFTIDNLPIGMPEVPKRWDVYGGFCHRQPFLGRRVVNCWAIIVFPDWPNCRIFDKYRVRRIGRRIDARMLGLWTSDTTDCPGDWDTLTIEPAGGDA